MRIRSTFLPLSQLLIFYGLTLLVPLFVAFIFRDQTAFLFLNEIGIVLGCSLVLRLIGKKDELRHKEGFLLVLITWLLMGFFASIPFVLWQPDSWANAFFEGFSGVTTTGAEVYHLDAWPKGLLFYHQWLQWVGGVGILVLAMTVLDGLGATAQTLYQTEVKDQKITPRIIDATRAIVSWYCVVTLFCIGAYKVSGMEWFDGVCLALSTVSTGGFFIRESNLMEFSAPAIRWVCMVFMVLGSLSFRVHHQSWKKRDIRTYWKDQETRSFLKLTGMVVFIVSLLSFLPSLSKLGTWTQQVVQWVSMMTTTGFTQVDVSEWSHALLFPMILLCLMGGCSGSTTGGVHINRVQLMYRELRCSLLQLLHPRAVLGVQVGDTERSATRIQAMRGFLALWMLTGFIGLWLLLILGVPLTDAWAALVACLSNTGAAVGHLAQTGYGMLNAGSKIVLVVIMVMGRVEILLVYLIVMPRYWRS